MGLPTNMDGVRLVRHVENAAKGADYGVAEHGADTKAREKEVKPAFGRCNLRSVVPAMAEGLGDGRGNPQCVRRGVALLLFQVDRDGLDTIPRQECHGVLVGKSRSLLTPVPSACGCCT